MTFEFSSWQIVSLVVLGIGALLGFGKVLLMQIDKQLQTQFDQLTQQTQRQDAQLDELSKEVQRVDRDILKLQADLPLQYVRREDYVRNQTVIEAKLDAIALRFENSQFRGKDTP